MKINLFDDRLPEIYSIINEADNEVVESESFVEQCRENSEISQLNLDSLEISEVSLPNKSLKREPMFLSAVEAFKLQHA